MKFGIDPVSPNPVKAIPPVKSNSGNPNKLPFPGTPLIPYCPVNVLNGVLVSSRKSTACLTNP